MRSKILLLLDILFVVLFSIGVSARTCTLETSCTPEKTVMKLSGTTNAHGEIWSQTNYNQYLCCDFTTANPHACSGNNKLLKLSSITNAHAEIATGTAYTTDVCFGDLNCISATSCSESDTIALRLSDITNAHIAGPLETNYNTLICCDFNIIGDGIISGPEECDDGNTNNGDGCSSTGEIEPGWNCSGEPSVCIPACEFTSAEWSSSEVSEGTSVGLNVQGNSLCNGWDVQFEVFEKEFIGRNPATTNPANVVFDGNSATGTWIAEWIDDGVWQENPEYVFKASLVNFPTMEIDDSGELTVLPNGSSEIICVGINSCSDYLTEMECETDGTSLGCGVAYGSVQANNPLITCGEGGVTCGCEWVSNKCGPYYTSVIGSAFIGTCFYDETTDDNCDDGFLSYSWIGTWTWGESNGWVDWNDGPSGDVGDYILDGGKYYYDPDKKFDNCEDGSTLVECPASIQVGFFGVWNFIIAIIILVGIYYLREIKHKKK